MATRVVCPANCQQTGTYDRSCPRMAVRKPSIHFFPAIPARNNRSFDWFLIGEKRNRTLRTKLRNQITLCEILLFKFLVPMFTGRVGQWRVAGFE
jgi:hypothetical protein